MIQKGCSKWIGFDDRSKVYIPFISWAHMDKNVRSLVKLKAPSQSASLRKKQKNTNLNHEYKN
jgi:hypothetical protein